MEWWRSPILKSARYPPGSHTYFVGYSRVHDVNTSSWSWGIFFLCTELYELRPADDQVCSFFCRSLILFLERISVFGCLCICFLLAWWADSPIFINFVSKMWLWFHFSCESNACAIPSIYFNISFSCSTVSWRSPYEVVWEFSYFLEAWSV